MLSVRRLVLVLVGLAVLWVIGHPFYKDVVRVTARKRAKEKFTRRVENLGDSSNESLLPARDQLTGPARGALEELSVGANNVPPEAPSFELSGLDGETHSLDQHRGEWRFINFWATWCQACRQEMPSMQRLWEKYGGRSDFTMLAVNVQESRSAVKKYVDEKGLTFPVLLDSDGAVADSYHVTGIPETVIITPGGRTIGKAVGFRLWDSPDSLALWQELLESPSGGE